MKTEITEGNRLCAEFMGWTPILGKGESIDNYRFELLPYNKDWNILIKIVERIESMGYEVSITSNRCSIWNEQESCSVVEISDTKLSTTYTAVVTFIEHFNNLKG